MIHSQDKTTSAQGVLLTRAGVAAAMLLGAMLVTVVLITTLLPTPRAVAEEKAKEEKAQPSQDAPPTGGEAGSTANGAVENDTERRARVLAKVGETTITIGDIEERLAAMSPMSRPRYQRPGALQALLDKMLRFELLAQEAERRDYGKQREVVRAVKQSAVQRLMREELDQKIRPDTISGEEVKAFYENNAEEFLRPKMVRASHILVKDEQLAKQLIAEAKTGDERSFRELARKHSTDTETRLRGGDLRYFRQASVPGTRDAEVDPSLRFAAFTLAEVGDVADAPVPVGERFSVVRLTGLRPARSTPLAEAEASIRTRLWRKRRKQANEDLIRDLRARFEPQVSPELVDAIRLDDTTPRPPGFARSPSAIPEQKPAKESGK